MRTRLLKAAPFALLALLALLAVPSGASAQASRTWVSGVGDDVNPCSRTAPCRTYAGAYSKTAAGGEISAMDMCPCQGGQLTITKPITISGFGSGTSVLTPNTGGFVINAAADHRVVLRNLKFNGLRSGTDAIRVLGAGTVRLDEVSIQGYDHGVRLTPSTGQTRLIVADARIHHNMSNGILLAPTGDSLARAVIRRTDIEDNGNGIVADGTFGSASVNLAKSEVTDNGPAGSSATGYGLQAIGAGGIFRFSNNDIVGNLVGLRSDSGGQLLSAGDNFNFGNATDGAPTGSIGKR